MSTSTIQTRRNGRTRLLILAVVLVTGGLSYYFYTAALTRKDAVERPEVVAKRTQVHALGRLEPTGTDLHRPEPTGTDRHRACKNQH